MASKKDGTKALDKHVTELTGHLLDSADYNAHGFAQGRQGRAGHEMVPNNLHLQGGAHMCRRV
jgi:hypothetical protein